MNIKSKHLLQPAYCLFLLTFLYTASCTNAEFPLEKHAKKQEQQSNLDKDPNSGDDAQGEKGRGEKSEDAGNGDDKKTDSLYQKTPIKLEKPVEPSTPADTNKPDPSEELPSDARFTGWSEVEVPVIILLGQSNTDGRAVYSFAQKSNPTESRSFIYPNAKDLNPCDLKGSEISCEQLDMRSAYMQNGKLAGGLNDPKIEFTSTKERAILKNILKKEAEWNSSKGQGNTVWTYVPPFDGVYGSHIGESEIEELEKKGDLKGWWEVMQPRESSSTSPKHLMNSVVGNSNWNVNEIFGPEVALAVKWKSNVTEKPLYIIKFAVGGTSLGPGAIYHNWNINSDHNLWQLSRKLIEDATKQIYESGKKPRLVGIYWGQGEADVGKNSVRYKSLLASFIQNVRKDLKVSEAKFYIQHLYGDADRDPRRDKEKEEELRKGQISACKEDGNCTLLSLDALKQSHDKWLKYPGAAQEGVHYTAHGELAIGSMLFNSLSKEFAKAPIIPMP